MWVDAEELAGWHLWVVAMWSATPFQTRTPAEASRRRRDPAQESSR